MEEKMSKNYEPDSRFVERLEWQLSSEYRRANRLRAPSGKIAVPRTMAAIILIVGILMTGVAVTKAADYIKDSWRKKIEIARAETEVKLKKAHLESVREMASRNKELVSNAMIRKEEYQAMKIAAEKAELDLNRSLLNLDEVKMTGAVPSDKLYAPKVRGRDFVSERLNIEIKEIELNLELLRTHAERIKQPAEKNMNQQTELDNVQRELANQQNMIDKIEERLDLRKRFVAGEITAHEIEIKGRITLAERNLHLAQSKVDILEEQMKRLKALGSQGKISQIEIRQLEYGLDAAQAELKLAMLERDILEKVK
jgi:multidrug resistance efflux pump